MTEHTQQEPTKCNLCISSGGGDCATCEPLYQKVHSRPHTSATPAPAACEDNGCTDPEACDEICEHSRIYSPAWVRKHDKEEREKVLKGILMAMNDPQLSICDTGYLEHTYWVDYIKSLRTTREEQ